MYNAEHAVFIDPDGVDNNTIVTLQFNNSYFDTTIGPTVLLAGKVLNSGTGNKNYKEIMFSNCFFRDSTNHHVKALLDGSTDYKLSGLSFTGCQFSNCPNTSIRNSSGSVRSMSVTGCQFEGCNKNGGETYAIIAGSIAEFSATGNLFLDNLSRQVAPSARLIEVTPIADASIVISDNNSAIAVTGTPYYYTTYPTTAKSLVINADQGQFGDLVTLDRVIDTNIAAGATTLIGVVDVPENFAGICEYTVVGNDDAGAGTGHQSTTGVFSFRRPTGGSATVYNAAQPFNHTFGTLGSNAVQVAVYTPNAHVKVVNAHTGPVTYSCRLRVMMRYAGT
jgi:hypothetical protein